MNRTELTSFIKSLAVSHGFLACGIAQAAFLEEDAPRLEKWLKDEMHGEMHYMANHFDKRLDPRLLVDDAKSVISLLYTYHTDIKQNDPMAPMVSKYAFGEDYHIVLKDKLHQMLAEIKEQFGEISGRVFVDSAPVLERSWAVKCGLGWIGKNGNLISKRSGSFFFLCELIIDVSLDYDDHIRTDHCGTCTACIDACPTDAIIPGKVVDGSKCISYFTIELKNELPLELKGKFMGRAFGCDICQDVCPWNRFAVPHHEPRFNPAKEMIDMNLGDWQSLSLDNFNRLFKKSALKRAGYNGIKRNIVFLSEHEDH